MRLSLRRPVAGRRPRRAAQAGGLFNLTRLLGALVMLSASASLNWLTSPDQFRVDPARVNVVGLRYTPAAQAAALIEPEIDRRPNLFRLRTQFIARQLEALPAVAGAEVVATLPDALAVHVTERVPVLIWEVGADSLLVDAAGVVISDAPPSTTGLPHVVDRRTAATTPSIGGRLDSIDLAAALRLAALTPELLGSEATGLRLEIEDENGWLLHSEPPAWRAAFGHYTTNLRPPTIIDAQVQCLRSLLAENEARLEVAFLSPSEDRCGTFRVRPTPGARIFQNVVAQMA